MGKRHRELLVLRLQNPAKTKLWRGTTAEMNETDFLNVHQDCFLNLASRGFGLMSLRRPFKGDSNGLKVRTVSV